MQSKVPHLGSCWSYGSYAGNFQISMDGNSNALMPKLIYIPGNYSKLGLRVIFLDIDGVLNGSNFFIHYFYRIMYRLNLRKLAHRAIKIFGVHESKVRRLAKIIESTGAVVVLSSSWRGAYKRYLANPDEVYLDDIRKLDQLFKKYHIRIIDTTGHDPNGRRGREIYDWLAKHEDEVYSFCIIDDEKFDIEELFTDRLVYLGVTNQTTGYQGLRSLHIKQAVEILSTPMRFNPEYDYCKSNTSNPVLPTSKPKRGCLARLFNKLCRGD